MLRATDGSPTDGSDRGDDSMLVNRSETQKISLQKDLRKYERFN